MKKIILKIKQLFCKHEWEFFDNDGDYPDFSFCEKCKKEIWYVESYIINQENILSNYKKK